MATSLRDSRAPIRAVTEYENARQKSPRALTSDEEFVEDSDLSTDQDAPPSPEHAEGVLGISISSKQSYMRSANTPSIEKTIAFGDYNDYFNGATAFDGSAPTSPRATTDESARRELGALIDKPKISRNIVPATVEEQQPSPWKAEAHHSTNRLSISRNILAESFSKTRKRANSGPASIAEHFRKMLPDVSSIFPSRAFAMAGSKPDAKARDVASGEAGIEDQNAGDTLRYARGATVTGSPTPGDNFMKLDRETRGKGKSNPKINTYASRGLSAGQMMSNDSLEYNTRASSPPPATSPPLLRHSNSENSLFLRRTVSGASKVEDPSQFANVSDMVNSRFKAITDSMQDASLLPRMPRFDFSSLRPGIFDKAPGDGMKSTQQSTKQPSPFRDTSPIEVDDQQGESLAKANIIEHRKAHPILHEALAKTTGDVVILGGYRGSILRSAEPPHRQLWVPIKVGLNIRKVDLEVGLEREDEIRMPETIFPSGILAHIGPVDIARRLLRHFHKCPNNKSGELRVHNYGYDWRLSPDLLADQLIRALASMQCNTPRTPASKRGAWVIAHSTGGLIIRYAVNKRPELFAGVIYAGVPQACVNILGPLRNGDDVLISSRVLTAQVNFTFRTSFALLPEDGRCFIDKQTGERYDIDFFDPKVWEEYRLSPCIKPPLPPQKQQRKSIVDAFSDSIPSMTSRPAWLGGRPSTPEQSATDSARNVVEDTAKNVVDTLGKVTKPEADAYQSFEPTMNSSHPSSLFSSSSNSIKTACTIPYDKAYAYLSRTLIAVREFRQGLTFRKEHEITNLYPPISYIYGKTVPTVYTAKVASREAIKQSDAYEDLAFAAGDGVVLASMAQLPRGYRCVRGGRVESERGHVGLLGDLEAVGQALNAIIDARAKGVGLGKVLG